LLPAKHSNLGIVAAQGATKLDRAKAELVAKLIGGLGKLFEFFAAIVCEQVALFPTFL